MIILSLLVFILVTLVIFLFIQLKIKEAEMKDIISRYENKIITDIMSRNVPDVTAVYESKISDKKTQVSPGKMTEGEKISLILNIEKEMRNDFNSRVIAPKLLKPFLEDSDIFVRLQAIKTLHVFNPADATKMLSILSKNSNSNIRIAVAEVLGQVLTMKTVQILLDMADDKDINVRKKVLKILIDIKNRNLIPSEEFMEKLKLFLKQIRAEEKWIME